MASKPIVKARGERGAGMVFYPLAQETDYARRLRLRTRRLFQLLRSAFEAYGAQPSRFVEAVERIERQLVADNPASDVARAGVAVDAFASRQVARFVGESLAIDPRRIVDVMTGQPLAPLLDVWSTANVGLIRNLDQTQLSTVREIVARGQAEGIGAKALADDIAARAGIAERRAQLIARDQVGKLNAAVGAQRQTSLGITSYRWQTALDERVRASHRARQGAVFDWAKPPDGGHPGEDINCRCVAQPIIPKDLDIFGDDK
jgi:SPP1 gp7 family putative phage head morphogenesis protein